MRKNLFLIRSFIRLHIIYMFLKAIHILKNKGILQWNFLSYKQTNCITVQCPIPAQCSIFISLKTPKNEMFSVVLKGWNISTNMLKIGRLLICYCQLFPFHTPLESSEKLRFYDVFRLYKKRAPGINVLICFTYLLSFKKNL